MESRWFVVDITMIGRPVNGNADLRELGMDFGASGLCALHNFAKGMDGVTILAIKHQREGN